MNSRTGIFVIGVAFAMLITTGCAVSHHQQFDGAYVDDAYVEDNIITSTIRARYAKSSDLAETNITVETLYGVVLLSGVAKNLLEKTTAQNIAEQVDGVKAVHNAIVLQPLTSEEWQPRRTARQLLSMSSDVRLTYL